MILAALAAAVGVLAYGTEAPHEGTIEVAGLAEPVSIAWGDSGLKETTLRAYASNLRGIVKGEIMQGMPFPGLTKGMSLGDPKTVRIVRGARDYEEGGNQHYTALKKLLAFADALEGSKARARKRRCGLTPGRPRPAR